MPQQAEGIPLSGLQIEFVTKTYRTFVVRYCIRLDNNSVVYQFFTEDPKQIEQDQIAGRNHKHVQFPPHFKDCVQRVFERYIPEGRRDRLDFSYVGIVNSYCMLLRGYAQSPGLRRMLDPLFEMLDKEVGSATT